MTSLSELNTKNGDPSKNLDQELLAMLRYLRLGRLLSQWDETLAMARKGRYSSERLLKHVLEEECRAKRENARLLRRQRANITEMLEMETYPFSRQPKLDRKKVMSYYDSFEYMTKRRSMVWLGPTGCGKTGLATAFLLNAIDRGYRSAFDHRLQVLQLALPARRWRCDRLGDAPGRDGLSRGSRMACATSW